MPTPASAFAKARTWECTFPGTGRSVVLLESLPVSKLIREGVFDDDLIETFTAAGAGQVKDIHKMIRLQDVIVEAMWVDPKVTVDGANGTVALDQITEEELTVTMGLAFGGAQAVARFLEEQNGSADGADSGSVEDDAKPAARPRTRKPRSVRA